MHSTFLRREHIHGALIGAAVGDALGYRYKGVKPRAQQDYGAPPLKYSWIGGGIYTPDTHLMLMGAQSLLNSRSDLRGFRKAFRRRLCWYLLSFPVGCGWATASASLKCWFMRFGVKSGVASEDNGPGAMVVFSALAIHGTGHRVGKWVDETIQLTRTNVDARDAAIILGTVADAAATTKADEFDATALLAIALDAAQLDRAKDCLTQLQGFLDDLKTPTEVANHFGWENGMRSDMTSTMVMALYCWLLSPADYRQAVESAIRLGGDTSSLGAVVGGLVGAHSGVSAVPEPLIRGLGGTPHGPEWIQEIAERFSHWPHGPDDLHMAPAQPSDPPVQLVRNLYTAVIVVVRRIFKPRR